MFGGVDGYDDTGTISTGFYLPESWQDPFWLNGSDTYYIGMLVDSDNDVFESDEFNNDNNGWLDSYDDVYIYDI